MFVYMEGSASLHRSKQNRYTKSIICQKSKIQANYNDRREMEMFPSFY